MEAANGTNLFELLPIEVITMIHEFISHEDRLSARFVCKTWFKQMKIDHFVVNILLPNKIPSIIENFLRYRELRLTINKSDLTSEKQLHQLIANLTDATRIEVNWLYRRSGISTTLNLAPFVNLQKLVVPFQVTIPKVIKHVTYLDVGNSIITYPKKILLPKVEVYLGPMNGLSLLNPDTLTSLTIKGFNSYQNKFSFNEFSKLKKLDIVVIDPLYSVEDPGPFSGSEPRDPLDLKLPYLEELHVSMDFSLTSTRLTRLTLPDSTFKDPKFDHNRYNSLKALTIVGAKKTKYMHDLPSQLEELVWRDNGYTGIDADQLPISLTKLSALATDDLLRNLFRLINLQELHLKSRVSGASIHFAVSLPKLKKLTGRKFYDIQINFDLLPSLISLDLQFDIRSDNDPPMILTTLTGLRELILPIMTNKQIIGIEALSNLEHLEVPYVTDDVFDNATKLTYLSCWKTDTCHQVSKLTRLRALDYCFTEDKDIIGLTNLQHLTYLICRRRTCNTMYLTLLTRLQSLAVTSNVSERSDWRVAPWSRYNAQYEITSKLPHLILAPSNVIADKLF